MRWYWALRQRWHSFWFEPVEPVNLGVCRLLFFGAFFLLYLPLDVTLWAGVSDVFWMPVWLFRRFHLPVLSAPMLGMFQGFWKVALGLSCLGLFTRTATSASFLFGVYLLGLPHNFGKTHHFDAIVVFVLGIMALARCGDSWSVDRLIAVARRGRGSSAVRPVPSGEYAWPVRLVWALMALIFLGAGVSKLRHSGFDWIVSDNLAIMLLQHVYQPVAQADPLVSWSFAVARARWLCQLLAGATIVLEVGYPLALISRRARWVIVPGAFLMQVGIRLLMGPTFHQFLICNLFWVPWDGVGRWLVCRFRGRQPCAVFFDGACGLCQGTVSVIRSLDLMQRVDCYDARHQWPVIESKFPCLNQEACLEEMHVITPDGKCVTGFYAYRELAWVLPLGWVALPLLYLPGVSLVGRWVYTFVASRRHRGGCPLPLRSGGTIVTPL